MEPSPLCSGLFGEEILCKLSKDKCEQHPNHKTPSLQSALPAEYTNAIVAQNWKGPTS